VTPTTSTQISSPGSRQTAVALRAGNFAPSVIGPDLIIQGNLISKGEVQVEGEVQGDIHGTHIVIGEKARITGGIIAEECIIRGHVLGTVRSRRVLLQTNSHVEGDIYHQTVAIEQGAFFEGKSRRTDDPIAGITRPERQYERATILNATVERDDID
jgi:cytoskeletal protein CcmA (bactofilin family)